MTKKPKTKITSLYRVRVDCQLGRDYLEGKRTIENIPPMYSALYSMFHAIEDLAKMIEEKK